MSEIDKAFWLVITGDLTEKMFEGRLPVPGECVEIVCVEVDDNDVRFRLRVVGTDKE